MATHSSFSDIIHNQCFVLSLAEVALSQKAVKPSLLWLINFDSFYYKQLKVRKFICITRLSRNRHRTFMSYSCSQVVSPNVLLAANGFLPHSHFEESTHLNYMKTVKNLKSTQAADEKFTARFHSIHTFS